MSRQAKLKREVPTTRSIVTCIVSEYRKLHISYSYDGRADIQKKHAIKKLEDVLGVRFATKTERQDFPKCESLFTRDGLLVELPTEEYAIFTPIGLKGDENILRKRGNEYIEDLIINGLQSKIKRIKNKSILPDHVKKYMTKKGLNANAIEILSSLLWNIEFTHMQDVYKIRSSFDKETRKKRDDSLRGKGDYNFQYNMDLEKRVLAQLQINLPGNPKVRIIQKGISIATQIPQSVMMSLEGKDLAEVIEIDGLNDLKIKRVVPYSDNIIHLHL